MELISSISQLYEVCSLLSGHDKPDDIVVVACDSGSDKSFDFLGAAKAIECLKDLLIAIFDRVAFYREERFARRIELVRGALPVYQQIEQLQQSNSISPEAAEIYKRKLTDGVSDFIESGAIIPEMSARVALTPRLLMSPEPKLLRSSIDLLSSSETLDENHDPTISRAISSKSSTTSNSLSKEEARQLQSLLQKFQMSEQDNDDFEADDSADNEDIAD